MAKQTMIDTTLLAGNATESLDLSGYANQMSFTKNVEESDTTTFSDLARRRIGSLADSQFSFTCLEDDTVEDPWKTLSDLLATAACYYGWIESNASMAEADRGVFIRGLQSAYEKGGEIGSVHSLSVSGSGDGPMIFGQVLQQDESLGSSSNSTGFQFGDLAAGETLHCVQWVLSVDAGSIVGTIESAAAADFVGSTTRATFTSATGKTTEEKTVSGAVTDTYWRYEYTITTGPSVVVCMIGKR